MHGRLLLPGGRKRPPFPPRYSQLPATTSSTRRLQAQGRHKSDLNAITPPASQPRRRFKPAISSTPCLAAQHADTTRQAAVYDTVVLEVGVDSLGVSEGQLGQSLLPDRKSTRLNSSHVAISYAVFCLKKKTKKTTKH